MHMMSTSTHTQLKSILALAGVALLAACADYSSTGSDYEQPASGLSAAEVKAASDGRFPELGICQNLKVDDGSTVSFKVFGKGVQVYRWTGVKWDFVEPIADLFADANGNGLVGTHFAGPTWLTRSGSQVVGTPATDGRCVPDANAVAWLKLNATASGAGVFEGATFIQRLNTVGGLAPSTPGAVVGDEVSVPYTADYIFYRAP
jgi:hypothetical protein